MPVCFNKSVPKALKTVYHMHLVNFINISTMTFNNCFWFIPSIKLLRKANPSGLYQRDLQNRQSLIVITICTQILLSAVLHYVLHLLIYKFHKIFDLLNSNNRLDRRLHNYLFRNSAQNKKNCKLFRKKQKKKQIRKKKINNNNHYNNNKHK